MLGVWELLITRKTDTDIQINEKQYVLNKLNHEMRGSLQRYTFFSTPIVSKYSAFPLEVLAIL